MAIRPRPPKAEKTNEDKALSFINKGGSVAGEKNLAGAQPVNVKIPLSMLSQIDEAVKKRRVPIYRVQWILEAILEKLERENASS